MNPHVQIPVTLSRDGEPQHSGSRETVINSDFIHTHTHTQLCKGLNTQPTGTVLTFDLH